MQIGICTYMHCAPSSVVEIPGITNWQDIKEWFVKWDTLHYTLDGETWLQKELNSHSPDCVDWKRPNAVRIYDPLTHETIEEEDQ